jgi:hypothetical protein
MAMLENFALSKEKIEAPLFMSYSTSRKHNKIKIDSFAFILIFFSSADAAFRQCLLRQALRSA